MKDCSKGQEWKKSVIDFNMNYPDNLLLLEKEISDGTYRSKPDNVTYIHERGKTRKINSQHIRDRIVHKIINQDILIPIFHRRFIKQNYASQKGKGVDFALKSFKCHLNRAYRKWGKEFYVLSIDMEKYFENISHEYILSILKKEIHDDGILNLCCETMRTYGGNKGLGLGSEINQTYALLCLDEYDHIIKEKFRIKEYGRYMDDIYIIHSDSKYLKDILDFSNDYFENIGMKANRKKTNIFPVKNGLNYLGFRWKLSGSGHVFQIVKSQTVTRGKKKLRKLRRKLNSGKIKICEIQNCYSSMRGNIARGNCASAVKGLDRYYNNLFIEGWDNFHD